ncbi:hypothetical protein [Haladaptatus caseinilyticus]|uniref:hypothetical protein n=1 Tax=Haladaptatus caseinilyticus TaxID=2993314 RepID=UPI00224A4B4D|nr:hypothetical protein [Haladaptatus caseinilyticus]
MTGRTIRHILSIPRYAALFIASFLFGLSVFVISQNIELVQTVIFGKYMTAPQKLSVLAHLFPIIGSAFTPIKAWFLLVSSAFFGMNFSMIIYHFRNNKLNLQSGTGSAIGMLFGTLGAGCAACGSVMLTGLLSFLGATSILTLLPFDGLSFSIIALIIFTLSMYRLADAIDRSNSRDCPIGF